MGSLVYSLGVSLDGFIAGPDGEIDWTGPDEELHRFHNDHARETDTFLYGRRMYEVMAAHWPTADADPASAPWEVEFARIWQDKPKVVFSTTLDRVEHNSRLVRRDAATEVAALKEQPGGDMAVGGAGLASTLMQAGLIDDYRLFLYPIVLGAGRPYFPTLQERIHLNPVETKSFDSGVVYLRYRVAL